MKKIYENKKLIIIISSVFILIGGLIGFINKEESNEEEISLNLITKQTENDNKENMMIFVDIKGDGKLVTQAIITKEEYHELL